MFVGTIASMSLALTRANVRQVNIAVVKIADVLDRVLEKSCKGRHDCASGESCCSSNGTCALNCTGQFCSLDSHCGLNESCCDSYEGNGKCCIECNSDDDCTSSECCGSGNKCSHVHCDTELGKLIGAIVSYSIISVAVLVVVCHVCLYFRAQVSRFRAQVRSRQPAQDLPLHIPNLELLIQFPTCPNESPPCPNESPPYRNEPPTISQ